MPTRKPKSTVRKIAARKIVKKKATAAKRSRAIGKVARRARVGKIKRAIKAKRRSR